MKLSPTGLLEPTARRLSALDASFLRLESSQAHMHVGWSAVFDVPDPNGGPTLAALRVGKIHHALVDGIAALQIVGLIVDEPEQGNGVAASSGIGDRAAPSTSKPQGPGPSTSNPGPVPSTSRPQGPVAWTIDELAHAARTGLGTMLAAAGAAIRPTQTVRAAIRDGERLLSAARTDVLPRAPASHLDSPLSPRRSCPSTSTRPPSDWRRCAPRWRG
jgi:hypothetical protein